MPPPMGDQDAREFACLLLGMALGKPLSLQRLIETGSLAGHKDLLDVASEAMASPAAQPKNLQHLWRMCFNKGIDLRDGRLFDQILAGLLAWLTRKRAMQLLMDVAQKQKFYLSRLCDTDAIEMIHEQLREIDGRYQVFAGVRESANDEGGGDGKARNHP